MMHAITEDSAKKALKLKYGHAIFPDGVRKIKAGHVIDEDVNGAKLARKFYSASAFGGYTGTFTVSQVTGTDGKAYELYTLTNSGTLTLLEDAQVWICGGGCKGNSAGRDSKNYYCGGGGGAGAYCTSGNLSPGTFVITIGSANAKTTVLQDGVIKVEAASGVMDTSYMANGGDGGTGGGKGNGGYSGSSFAGTGDGKSKYPFGITSLGAHCAGGAGGAMYYSYTSTENYNQYGYSGCNGGTNGGSGSASGVASGYAGYSSSAALSAAIGGTGGTKGGGNGGSANSKNGSAATFFGSGGGGGARYNSSYGAGGAGYQGVCYLLIPA